MIGLKLTHVSNGAHGNAYICVSYMIESLARENSSKAL